MGRAAEPFRRDQVLVQDVLDSRSTPARAGVQQLPGGPGDGRESRTAPGLVIPSRGVCFHVYWELGLQRVSVRAAWGEAPGCGGGRSRGAHGEVLGLVWDLVTWRCP